MNFKQIFSLASALGVEVQHPTETEHDHECVSEGVDAMCCINEHGGHKFGGCLTCIMDVMATIEEADTCDTLKASDSFCKELKACIDEEKHCNSAKCGGEMEDYMECAKEGEEEACPDLCESELGYAITMPMTIA